jgi:hypothetical protein
MSASIPNPGAAAAQPPPPPHASDSAVTSPPSPTTSTSTFSYDLCWYSTFAFIIIFIANKDFRNFFLAHFGVLVLSGWKIFREKDRAKNGDVIAKRQKNVTRTVLPGIGMINHEENTNNALGKALSEGSGENVVNKLVTASGKMKMSREGKAVFENLGDNRMGELLVEGDRMIEKGRENLERGVREGVRIGQV